jgi:hypothetical protein
MAGLKDAVLALREEVLLAAEENEKRTMQKCAQTLMAATGLKMLASRMTKTSGLREDVTGNLKTLKDLATGKEAPIDGWKNFAKGLPKKAVSAVKKGLGK